MLAYRFFGVVLLAAAIVKFGSPATASLAPVLRSFPYLLPLVIASELLIGGWIVSGMAARAGRVVALGLLGVFIAVNLTAAAAGAPSCGCLGSAVTVPPLLMACLELAYLVLLLFPPTRVGWSEADGHALWGVALAGALLAAYLGYGRWQTGTFAWDWPGRNPDRPAFEGQLPEGEAGSETQIELAWENRAGAPVQLTYLRSGCGCLRARDLPIWVAPGGTARFPVAVTRPSRPGGFQLPFTIDTTHVPLRGVVRGHVPATTGVAEVRSEALSKEASR